VEFLTEAVEVIFIQTAFHVRTCVHARRGVSLEEDLVAARWIVLAAEEVVKANFIQRSSTGIGRDVATDANAWALLTVHHDGRIPTNPVTITLFQFLITRELRLNSVGNGLNDSSRRYGSSRYTLGRRALQEAQHKVSSSLGRCFVEQAVERIHPLAGFFRVAIVHVRGNSVADEWEIGIAL